MQAPTTLPQEAAAPEDEKGESFDSLTPPPQDEPDDIEVAATRIQRRSEAIQNRPGLSPSPEAVSTAITVHTVRTELKSNLEDVKAEVKAEIAGIHTKVDNIKTNVDGVSKKVDDILPKLIDTLVADRNARREEDQLVVKKTFERDIATIEVKKKKDLSDVEISTVKRTAQWKIIERAALFIFAAATTLLTISKC